MGSKRYHAVNYIRTSVERKQASLTAEISVDRRRQIMKWASDVFRDKAMGVISNALLDTHELILRASSEDELSEIISHVSAFGHDSLAGKEKSSD